MTNQELIANEEQATYERIADLFNAPEDCHDAQTFTFYAATQPALYDDVTVAEFCRIHDC